MAKSVPKAFVVLKGQQITLLLLVGAALMALCQLVMGASPSVVVFCLVGICTGLFSFAVLGTLNLASWLVFFYVLGNVLVALYAKTLYGQALDSNLFAPLNSYIAIAVTATSMAAAVLVARFVPTGRPLFSRTSDLRYLSYLSWTCLIMGAASWLLNRWFQDDAEIEFGGLAVFRDLVLMAVIARTAMLLEGSRMHTALDWRLVLVMAISVTLGLLDNSKTLAALPVVSHIATVLFFRKGISRRAVLVVVIGGAIFVGLIAPLIHGLRALGQQELSINQRVELVATIALELLRKPAELEKIANVATSQFEDGYYSYFGEGGTGQMLLGRYASIQQIDPVIDAVDREGPLGGKAIWPAFARITPSFIYPNKPAHTEAFNTLVHYRLVSPYGGKFPTLPLAGQVYAAYGFGGLLIIPLLTFLAFSLVVKKLGWSLHRNIFAIFFLCQFVIVYASQGDFGQYLAATLRTFPLFAALFGFFFLAYRLRKHLLPVGTASEWQALHNQP